MLNLPQRFLSKVKKTETCWLWQGSLNKKGYGQFWWEGKLVRAHRFIYEYTIGTISPMLSLDHLCRVRKCVNPKHLEVVTPRENTMRGVGITAVNPQKTQCNQGHPYDLFNTYFRKTGGRRCRICHAQSKVNYKNARLAIG